MLSQSLGDVDRWDSFFKELKDLGYNSIHFTPVQELGISNSAYCVYDQLEISSTFFKEPKISPEEKKTKMISVLKKLENDNQMFLITDVVWNHTARNSPWLSEHPEATYNLENSPYLLPSFIVDDALQKFSEGIINGDFLSDSITPNITTEADIKRIMNFLEHHLIPSLKLWEYYVVDVEEALEEFKAEIQNTKTLPTQSSLFHGGEVEALKREGMYRDEGWGRFSLKVNAVWAVKLFGPKRPFTKTLDRVKIVESYNDYKDALCKINLPFYERLNDDIRAMLTNIENRIRYERLSHNAPKRGPLSKDQPLVDPYFSKIECNDGTTAHCLNNGWVWGGNQLKNFADYPASSYFRRDVIVWSDLVKLRYGKRYQDNPWLWEYMRKYTEQCAQLFHGFRIDNCHSTPIRVARYLMDAARRVRSNIYVIAELFTGNERIDNLFVNKLGINSLIRESMQPHNPEELGRIIKRYGGIPIGTLNSYYEPSFSKDNFNLKIPVRSSVPPAFLFDCTHDNETPIDKRTVLDALPNAAITWMSNLPVGTTSGYDILVAKNPSVCEKRLYPILNNHEEGILKARKILNRLHSRLANEGYTEFNVETKGNLILLNRHNPDTMRSVFCCAFTAFYESPLESGTINIPGKISKTIMACRLIPTENEFTEVNDLYITGSKKASLKDFNELEMKEAVEIKEVVTVKGDTVSKVNYNDVPEGSVIIFEVSLLDSASSAIEKLASLKRDDKVNDALSSLNLEDIQYLLYNCHEEEMEYTSDKAGVYDLPNYGRLPFAGIYGFVFVLDRIRKSNDWIHHPFIINLRDGNWAPDFTLTRLSRNPRLDLVHRWLEGYLVAVKRLPRYMIPKYFDKVIMKLYLSVRHYVSERFLKGILIQDDGFLKDLIISSLQFLGRKEKTPLISTSVSPSSEETSLAAGLPHFSVGFMRVWGRDTFIAFRGLLLIPGIFNVAEKILLGFASSLRHGLIPNLLDSGINPRYNARDATWWFLYAVQEYCKFTQTTSILKKKVVRLFKDDVPQHNPTSKNSLAEIIHEIMQKHASGIHFREHNAGRLLDAHMSDAGFNIDISLDPQTGLIFGGNQWNCGTWMDKMGESHEAQNNGIPATPRDGAAVEIIGLLKATLKWLARLHDDNPDVFPYDGVILEDNVTLTYTAWNNKVQDNFEKYFYVPQDISEDQSYIIQRNIVHRRGIYKDSYGSSQKWTDYQLRPNVCIAMVVAPELFEQSKAEIALKMIEKYLVGPLGMKTLDPHDKQYRPYYNSGEDSGNYFQAKGFNYHLGPEWLWLTGYFLRAKLLFCKREQIIEEVNRIQTQLSHHRNHLYSSPWYSLPELTNKDGSECYSSCRAQAWSVATIIETLYDINMAK